MPLPALTAMSSISLTAASLRPSLCARQLCATVALRCQLRAQKRFFVPTTANGSSLQVQAICITCQTDRRASVLLLLCHMRRAVDGPGGGCLRHQSGFAHSEALRLGSQCSWLTPVLLRLASACLSGLPPPVSLGLALPALSCTPAKDHTADHQTSLHPRSGSGTAGKRAGLHEAQLAGQGVEEPVWQRGLPGEAAALRAGAMGVDQPMSSINRAAVRSALRSSPWAQRSKHKLRTCGHPHQIMIMHLRWWQIR